MCFWKLIVVFTERTDKQIMFISNFYQLHNVWHIRWTVQRRQYCHTTADYRFAHDFKCRIQRLWLGEGRRYRGSKVPSGLQGQSPWWRLRGKSQRKRRFGGGVFKCFASLLWWTVRGFGWNVHIWERLLFTAFLSRVILDAWKWYQNSELTYRISKGKGAAAPSTGSVNTTV